MSYKPHHAWAIIPMLSILSIAPNKLGIHNLSRSLASETVVTETERDQKKESKTPLFDQLVSKVDPSRPIPEISKERLGEENASISKKITTVHVNLQKAELSEEEAVSNKKEIESIASEIVVFSEQFEQLKSKKLIEEDKILLIEKSIDDYKIQSEELLKLIEHHELIISEKKKTNTDKTEVVVAKAEEKPASTEENKNDTDNKKEEVKDEKVTENNDPSDDKKEICEHEKKEVLTSNADKLVQDQNLILQQLIGMNQMLMMLFQQQQIYQMQQQFQNQGPVNQQAYQYAPQSAGNWVYYQNGFRPGGQFPDQFGQYSSQMPQTGSSPSMNNWGLAPQNYFQNDPRMTPMQVNPGQFGQPAFGFDMSGGQLSQYPQAPNTFI